MEDIRFTFAPDNKSVDAQTGDKLKIKVKVKRFATHSSKHAQGFESARYTSAPAMHNSITSPQDP